MVLSSRQEGKTKIIVGLGNPGQVYRYNRHNIGFLLIDRLSEESGIKVKLNLSLKASIGKGRVEESHLILAKPLCFMNLSGGSVSLLLKKYNLNPENMLVVFDDLDLELGRIRIKPRGSSGGHKGAESIIKALGSSDFARLRIGIGRPTRRLYPKNKENNRRGDSLKQKQKIVDYVLSRWTLKEKKQLDGYLQRAADCCKMWVVWGMTKAMNEFN